MLCTGSIEAQHVQIPDIVLFSEAAGTVITCTHQPGDHA